eukprot:TRINITY_DN941_c0_g1_i1.p1 TRINITY_DN941_c0_g1~~TRINITY_DN941_c0_g1_i1.p1  ORF type:complete len:417 (-),score=14.16 TRINITY_DN941_c0_g1_i1:56-1306(-)
MLTAYHCIDAPFKLKEKEWTMTIGDLQCKAITLLGYGPFRTAKIIDPISSHPYSLNTDVAVLGIVVENESSARYIHGFVKPLKPYFEPIVPNTRFTVVGYPHGILPSYDYGWLYSRQLNPTSKTKEECNKIVATCTNVLSYSIGEVIFANKDAIASTYSTLNGMSGGPVLLCENHNVFVGINHGSQAMDIHFREYILGTVAEKLNDDEAPLEVYGFVTPDLASLKQKGYSYSYIGFNALLQYGEALYNYFNCTKNPMCYNLGIAVRNSEVQRLFDFLASTIVEKVDCYEDDIKIIGRYLFTEIVERNLTFCFAHSKKVFHKRQVNKQEKASFLLRWKKGLEMGKKRFEYDTGGEMWKASVSMSIMERELYTYYLERNGERIFTWNLDPELIGVWPFITMKEDGNWKADLTPMFGNI